MLPSPPTSYRQLDDNLSHLQATELVIPKPEPSPVNNLSSEVPMARDLETSPTRLAPTSPATAITPAARAHGQLWSVASLTEQKNDDDDKDIIGRNESQDNALPHRISSIPFYRRDVRMYENSGG